MDSLSIAGLAVGAAVIGLSNIPVVWSKCRRSSSQLSDGYSDEDGEATVESIKSLGGKWSLGLVIVLSVIGLACASATAVLSTLEHGKGDLPLYWIQFAAWVGPPGLILIFQANSLGDSLYSSVRRPSHGEFGRSQIHSGTLRLLDQHRRVSFRPNTS